MAPTPVTTPAADIDLRDFFADPYPTYARLRRETPVVLVPQLGLHLVTRHEDVAAVLGDPEAFGSATGFQSRVVGEILMQKDGEAHRRERRAMEPPLKPRALQESWTAAFQANASDLIDAMATRGVSDLLVDFAAPLAARNLASVLGFEGVSADLLTEWCKGIMDAGANVADDPEVWAAGFAAREGVVAAIDASIERVRRTPDASVISAMVNAEDPLTTDQIYGNVMLAIGGGINEHRDVLLTGAYGVLADPEQRAAVEKDPALWAKGFEEAARWVSPIGIVPRRAARPLVVAGVQLQEGDLVAVVLASANRDASVFDNPDVFDLRRQKLRHLAFGRGPHFCAGAWMARIGVASVAWPMLFERLPNLRLEPGFEMEWEGFFFRGPRSLRVEWDA